MKGMLNCNDEICQYCSEKRKKLFHYVKGKKIKLVTMGPKGTTSSMAAEYFKKYALNNMNAADVEIIFFHMSYNHAIFIDNICVKINC